MRKSGFRRRNVILRDGIVEDDHELSSHTCRVLSIVSGKGGVGKTNLAVNLAIALGQMRQRVVLFDADLGLANAELLLGITPQYTLYDVVYGNRSLADVLLPGPAGIRLISGGSGFVELANLTDGQRRYLIDSLSVLDREADLVIVDTGAGLSKNVLAFAAAADEVLVVITPEPTSLADAYSVIKVLSKFRLKREVKLVVNRVGSEREAHDVVRRLKTVTDRFLDIDINYLGCIGEDKVVAHAVKKQQPFVLARPDSAAAAGVGKIAAGLLGCPLQGVGGVGTGGAKRFFQKIAMFFK